MNYIHLYKCSKCGDNVFVFSEQPKPESEELKEHFALADVSHSAYCGKYTFVATYVNVEVVEPDVSNEEHNNAQAE